MTTPSPIPALGDGAASWQRAATTEGQDIERANILLVEDDPGAVRALGSILAAVGTLRFATSGVEALRMAYQAPPDLILLDAQMPGMSGLQVCDALKLDPLLANVPVIFITSPAESALELAGLEIGAADFIAKPISAPLVLARVQTQLRVKRMAEELRRLAAVDTLTELANRRCLDETLAREWLRARRCGDAIALLLVDVDHFEPFNDHYGHPAGDVCLRSVAQAIAATTVRPADLVARYGGEEFALLLPQTPRGGAAHMANRVLDAVEALGIRHEFSPTAPHVTVSVGVATYDDASACWLEPSAESRFGDDLQVRCAGSDLLEAADKALYAAKRAGRAQARLLDIADVDFAGLVRYVVPALRAQRAGTAASNCAPLGGA